MTVTDLTCLPDILHGYRLASAGVVGHGQHADGNVLDTPGGDEFFQRFNIHVALERVHRFRVTPFGNNQVDCLCALRLDIGAGRVEMLSAARPWCVGIRYLNGISFSTACLKR